MKPLAHIQDFSLYCSLGQEKSLVSRKLMSGDVGSLTPFDGLISGHSTVVGKISDRLPPLPKSLGMFETRNCRLLYATYKNLQPSIEKAANQYGRHRIAVVLGSSTAGIAEGEQALAKKERTGKFPQDYNYVKQELGSVSDFICELADVCGPSYTISTACSSSAKVFVSAARLLAADLCDAVITGGADTLCKLTLNGFDSLEAIAQDRSNPFSENRKGINIGEASALMLLTRDPGPIQLLGVGESSDAHHISAPDPDGLGAERAIRDALNSAGLAPEDIGYINLHGTGTDKNDAMESKVIARIFGDQVPCSSTKPLTGHTLGAAGALELAFCCLTLTQPPDIKFVPPHIWDGASDPMLDEIQLAKPTQTLEKNVCMSNNFAFGGSNVSLIIGTEN